MIIPLLVVALAILLLAVDAAPVKERPDPWPCNRCGRPNWSRLKMCVECRGVLGMPRDFQIEAPPIAMEMPPDLRIDHAGRLLEDIACRGCGYNLRGLTPQSACPECSVPVAYSIRADLLRYSNPRWVDRIARGVGLMIVGLTVSTIFGLLASVLGSAALRSNGTNVLAIAMLSVIGMGFSGVYTLGVWQMTTRESDSEHGELFFSARQIARWAALVELLNAPATMATVAILGNAARVSGNPFTAPTPALILIESVALLVSIISLIGKISAFALLRRIATRLPSKAIAAQFAVVMWGYGLASGLAHVASFGVQIAMPGAMSNPGSSPGAMAMLFILGGTSCIAGISIILFSIWGLALLMTTYFSIKAAADLAHQNWYHGG